MVQPPAQPTTARQPAMPGIKKKMAGKAKGRNIDGIGFVSLADVRYRQCIFPAEVHFAGASTAFVARHTAKVVGALYDVSDFSPIVWIE